MIISELTGGLGNQMFQYAFGYSLAHRKKIEFRFHFEHYKGNTLRQFELNAFMITGAEVEAPELKLVGYPISLMTSVLAKMNIITSTLVQENGYGFKKEALLLPDNRYIRGYWQTEKYFLDCASQIRKQFTFKKVLDKKNSSLLEEITKTNSVSVHIRRGDYVHDKKTMTFHGACNLDYYKRSIKLMQKRVANPVFFFFSDEPDWVKSNIKTDSPSYYVDWNKGSNSYKDMQLMSKCKYNIIANSSFSWWGAWLNENSKKIIIAPKKWFNDHSIDTSDIIPKLWLKI